MSEFRIDSIRNKAISRMTVVLFGAVALVGCGKSSIGGDTTPPPGPIETYTSEVISELQCYARNNFIEDCDKDLVSNFRDVVPFKDDNADEDGDFVLNKLDKWPGQNDTRIDSDRDTIPDYLDSFNGNNYGDEDHDGLLNAFDLQPYTAPPSGRAVLPPSTISNQELSNQILLNQMKRKTIGYIYNSPDSDLDGISDKNDTNPTVFTNDRDGDGDPDYYDPEPDDGTYNSYNDSYDSSNDEYWDNDN